MAPDRERIPEAAPVVSFREDDERAFLTEVETRSRGSYRLSRRGVQHGRLAELRPEGLIEARPRRRRRDALVLERWVAARPILLPKAADRLRPALMGFDAAKLLDDLSAAGGLRALLDRRAAALAPEFVVQPGTAEPFDAERDIERLVVRDTRTAPDDLDGPDDPELWVKSGRLSTHAADRSLRVRVAFGREGDDDASADERAHARVGELARRLLPGASALEDLAEVRELLARLTGGPVSFTQHIAYLNAPEGGARFHHDAFDEDPASAQLGVAYTQLVGRTVWLALSIEELGARLREFLAALGEGDAPWLAEELGAVLSELQGLARERRTLLAELALPGCGRFGPLVDRGPEFTTFLADAGHALVLHPGDVLLLPNHGLERTAMHSVFCGSDEPTYALSVAVRRAAAQGPSRRG